MANWTEWMNVGSNYEDWAIETLTVAKSVFGGAELVNQRWDVESPKYTVTKSGKATMILNSYRYNPGKPEHAQFYHDGTKLYHNDIEIANERNTTLTIDVSEGDTIHMTGSFRVGSNTEPSNTGECRSVLTIIEHD